MGSGAQGSGAGVSDVDSRRLHCMVFATHSSMRRLPGVMLLTLVAGVDLVHRLGGPSTISTPVAPAKLLPRRAAR